MMPATVALVAAPGQSGGVAPLPAQSPIGGPLWSVVIPALLLLVTGLGTFMLYRHFAKQKD